MLLNAPLSAGRKRVFSSVFPQPQNASDGTSKSLPFPYPTAPTVSDGHHRVLRAKERQQQAQNAEQSSEQATWDRAWQTTTDYLSIVNTAFSPGMMDDSVDDQTILKRFSKSSPSRFVLDSIFYVAADASPGKELRIGLKQYDLQAWYMGETRRHFLGNFRQWFIAELKSSAQPNTLHRLVRYLRLVQNIYQAPFTQHILPLLDPVSQDQAFSKLRHCVHSLIIYSLPTDYISSLIAEQLVAECTLILGIRSNQSGDYGSEDAAENGDGMDLDTKFTTSYLEWRHEPSDEGKRRLMTEGEDSSIIEARSRLLCLLDGLQDVGLGGSRAQRVFAEVMNTLLSEFVNLTYTSQWESPSLATVHLSQWIENVFSRLVIQVLQVLKTNDEESGQTGDITLSDLTRWQEVGVSRLGSLRISELFDIIVEWDSSKGAIEDLRHYVLNPATRHLLTTSFYSALVSRLLHPGASTIEILQLYISIIRAFGLLDPRGVLLDKIGRPIRRYLKDRDDTVKVIVGGLLSEETDPDQDAVPDPEKLPELARELTNAHQQALREESGELDWDDMSWVPDPIDAAPDYKKSKTDVIGSLISLFDNKEVFVKELQKALSERLLRKTRDYETEISVLELLKLRFGDSSLQACEVMLRDVLDSKRVDSSIRAEQKRDTAEHAPELHAKILSRLYWPSLSDLTFNIPDEIRSAQETYSTGFESLKPSRKLTWLNSLGRVTVELDLEDRVFQDEVTTWEASVIYAFQSLTEGHDPTSPITKTVTELADQLSMSTSLVRSACLFWLSKRILVQTDPDTFRVLETLPDDEEEGLNPSASGTSVSKSRSKAGAGSHGADQAAAAAAAAAQEAAEKESANAEAMAKMDLYWQFIVGMLTNQGAMPLQRIIMMLKIVVPGGFPFSSEELKEFLGTKVAQGQLEMVGGGNYKIVK